MLRVPSRGDVFPLHAHPLPSQTQAAALKLVVEEGHLQAFPFAPPSSIGHIWGINPFLQSIESTMDQKAPDADGQKMDLVPPLQPPR